MLRPSVLAARQQLADGRETLLQRHRRGTPGRQLCTATADLLDHAVLDLLESALSDFGEDAVPGKESLRSHFVLVPHGGYGRRDVAPFSDVDLMILHTGRHPRLPELAERLVRDVFDAGLELGNSTRTVREALQLSAGDPSVFTSLVEARYLSGSVKLFTHFARELVQLARRRRGGIIAAIDRARGEERSQYGETVYLLEPNIKRSSGGLRDVQLTRWIGFAAYGSAEPERLRRQGVLSSEDYRALRDASEFLLRLRNEMHFHAGSALDHLDRAEQVRLADTFGFTGGDGLMGVEEFMRAYFKHTNRVSDISARLVRQAQGPSKLVRLLRPLLSHQVEGDYRVGPVHISATRRGLAKLTDLHQVLRLADLANQYDKRVDDETREAVRRAVFHMPDELPPEAARRFLSLMRQPMRLGELLRMLHQVAALERVVPAFRHARGLLQFNEYHQYTVDEHSLRAVQCATDFLGDTGPLGRAYHKTAKKEILHLALLIHDLGKGRPGDHSEVGLEIAGQTAARLGLSHADAETLKFLVHRHLLMSHLAYRRDTSDEGLITEFAGEVGSAEVLQMLYVLTAADLAAVGPGVLNAWKLDVLTSLYRRTIARFSADGDGMTSTWRLGELRDEVRRGLKESAVSGWLAQQVSALPASYFEKRSPEEIAGELRELERVAPGDVVAGGRYQPHNKTVEYTISTHEQITPGVFYKLTGALTSQGLEILDAEINTLAHGLIVDRFTVHDGDFVGEPPADRIEQVCQALRKSLTSTSGHEPNFRRVWPGRLGRRTSDLAPAPTRVRTDNNTSRRYTILDIFATDRPALLYTIARTVFDLGLSVSVAKIGTYLDQVVDVLYVTDQHGRKLESPQRLEQIRRRLLESIGTLEQGEEWEAKPEILNSQS